MKNRKWLYIAISASCIAGVLLLFVINASAPKYENGIFEAASAMDGSAKGAPDNKYLIKSSDDGIVVLYNDKTIKMFDIDVTQLPKESQQELKNGIAVYNSEELAQRLEDYME